jgi:type I restriction enzyme S subunit
MLLSNLDLLATAPGGVARLRELILTLAVQGKLVAQDPNDEPASELLKKIRAEKDRLIAEGKIKRDKPLVVIAEDEKPFELPVGWEWVRLGTLTNISTGKLDANAAVVDGQYPFFTCSNTPLSIDRFSFDCSAILLAGNGDFNLKHYTGKFDAYQRTYVIEPILLDLRFLYFTLSKYIGELTKNQRGSAIPYLKLGDITNPAIPIPPTAEQSRIVTRVEELMRLCDALEAKGQLETTQHAQLVNTLLATLTESETPAQLADNWHRIATHFDLLLDRPAAIHALEQTILQLAVRGLLVPQDPQDEPASELLKKIRAEKDKLIAEGKIKRDKPLPPIAEDEQPFGLPPGWEWVPIETLADVGTGTTPSRDNIAFFSGGSIPWVTSGETGKPFIAETAQYVTELALSQTSLTVYPVGTLIVAMYGQGKTRGQVSELQIEATTNQACAAIVLVEPSSAHRSFVKLVFEKSYDEIRELSAGGAQPNLNVGKIKSTLIPLPPLAEQSRIVTRVAQLRRLCTDLRQRLTASQSTQAHLAEALVDTVG